MREKRVCIGAKCSGVIFSERLLGGKAESTKKKLDDKKGPTMCPRLQAGSGTDDTGSGMIGQAVCQLMELSERAVRRWEASYDAKRTVSSVEGQSLTVEQQRI